MLQQHPKIIMPSPSELELMSSTLLKDFPPLESKLQKISSTYSLSEKTWLTEVIKFLYLIAYHNISLSPSLPVDLAWHEFILCTRLYTKFCEKNFGRYIHHTPGGDQKENQSKYKKTIQLYLIHFKEPAKEAWGDLAHQEWLESQCGTCKSD